MSGTPQGSDLRIGNYRGANYFLIAHRRNNETERIRCDFAKKQSFVLRIPPALSILVILIIIPQYGANASPRAATREVPQL